MPARTVEAHIESLLVRNVAEGKLAGAPRPDLEAAAIFDSIALNLMLKPRAALYFALLARNGLLAAIQDELAVVEDLRGVVQDIGNASFKIEGGHVLRRAYSALINLETLPNLDAKTRTTSISVSLYGKAVTEFLNTYLARNVKQRGSKELLRPGQEASQDMPGTVQQLRSAHEDLLERMYLLSSGIANFDAAPFGALLGSATVSRARTDLEEIMAHVDASGSPEVSRDFAARLLGSKAAITTVSQPPRWDDTLLPAGTIGTSVPTPAVATTAQGPFVIETPKPTVLALEVCGTSGSFYFFPGGSSVLVGEDIVFPLTIPPGGALFLTTRRASDGLQESWRIDVAGTYATLTQFLEVLNQDMNLRGCGIAATPFAGSSSRVMLYSLVYYEIIVESLYMWPDGMISGITAPGTAISINSAHTALGFSAGQKGTDQIAPKYVAEAVTSLFPALTAEVASDSTVALSTVATGPGAYIKVLSAPEVLGLSGIYRAESNAIVLGPGTVDQRSLVQVGDRLQARDSFNPGRSIDMEVAGVSESEIELVEAVPTFSAPIVGTSAVVAVYLKMESILHKFLAGWAETPFAGGMESIDKALAPLITSQSSAQRNMALAEIEPLRLKLRELLNLLGDDSTMLPSGAGKEERQIVEGILTTLAERHFLRAADMLLKCDLQSILGMDSDQASYGGAFLQASSTFARNSFSPPSESDGSTLNSVGY
jgi:hypothetical protein